MRSSERWIKDSLWDNGNYPPICQDLPLRCWEPSLESSSSVFSFPVTAIVAWQASAGMQETLFCSSIFLLFYFSESLFLFPPLAFRHRLPSLHYPSCSLLYFLPLSVMRIWLISIYFVAMVGTGVVAAGTLAI